MGNIKKVVLIVIWLGKYKGEIKNMQYVCENESVSMQKIIQILTHDIKTPIIALMRSLELGLEGVFGALNKEQSEIIMQTYESSKFLYKMMCELLMCCKYENGEIENIFQKLNFCALVRKCIVEKSSDTSKKRLSIKFISRVKSQTVYADKKTMKIAVKNLIYDAICRVKKNSEINVILQDSEKELSLCVNYECENMSEEILEQIFEKSVAGVAKYNTIGTDLNLSLCKEIVKVHRGHVFSSLEGGNINYGFIVPLCKENF